MRAASERRVERLLARTVPLDPPTAVDLLAVAGDEGFLWEHEGPGSARPRVGLAGRGVAVRIDLPTGVTGAGSVVAGALAAIDVDDRVGMPGCGPVALGALPFDHAAPASLVVPELLVGVDPSGAAWLTTVGPATRPVATLEAIPPVGRRPAPDSFTLTACRRHEDWCTLVDGAVDEIEAGRLAKVVLAREVLVEANRPLVPTDVLGRLRALYPSCMLFSFEGFLGASPELLVARAGSEVRSHPLAGTVARSGDPRADERQAAGLLASAKDRFEHALVVGAVVEGLEPLCDEVTIPETPSILPLRNVLHLATEVRGRLAEPAPSALELALRLHPTPAVAGLPTDDALAWLAAAEGFDRGRYAGPVGWVDARGDGEWALGIRSAELAGATARLRAGVGIVAGSVAGEELAETQLKLQALLAAVVRP